ncbi:MAG: RagB/SusD family nutrient uptake outer membrane protein [Bacteroidetes bacterium]|nr:RagB/SusD family nutrient uptake outer membrane protein [Bacteroidota bacterium]MBS1755644.1 RagB/SusD family nutrient uptake outer membrane protein [Bacteroidota bacterium]
MKYIPYLIIIGSFTLASCKKVIDLYPESNLNTATYYRNYDEVKAGVTACYNGLQKPMYREWQLTELRSDNSIMGSEGSTSSTNRDLSDLDEFIPATTHQGIYNYWIDTYNNIKNCNIVLQKLGVVYDEAAGAITLQNITTSITDSSRKQLAGEALFIRGYHYFNLVRLFGDVFLIHKPVSPAEAKSINRSPVADVYKLIIADLTSATTFLSPLKFSQIPSSDLGRANAWSAKALLAKVYLTLNRKADAITQLQDVMTNSGYSLQSSYANVFSINNEMNSEIIFAVRYKSGGLGLGSTFGNDFGPLNSGSTVINGSGLGWNTPTSELDTNLIATDARRNIILAKYGSGTAATLYVKKYLFPVVISGDGESDWPVIRFADVLLMMAEAKGFTPESIGYINAIRTRAGVGILPPSVNSVATFEKALSEERRLEFAFENQRWFDLLRYNTTMTTINAVQTIKDHFAHIYAAHYSLYVAPTPTLAELQANVTTDHLLLPIPQHEIDTNTQITIAQNPGY